MTVPTRRAAFYLLAAAVLAVNAACVAAPRPMASLAFFGAWKSASGPDEAEPGYGGNLAAGLSDGQNTVLGLARYTRLSFTGGHDQILSVGGQFRRSLITSVVGGPWLGAEATFMKEKSVYGYQGGDPTATGYTFGGLVGYRLPLAALSLNFFGGASYFHVGDFTLDDQFVFAGGNHVIIRGGAEIQIK